METPYCDVVGCARPGVWIRLAEGDAYVNDYLCQECRERLRRVRPAEATRYVALSRCCDAERDEVKAEQGWRVPVCY